MMSLEPTKAELEILQVLWEKGPLTVREVNNELLKIREVNYTTTLKQMQLMVDKRMLDRDESPMKHIYKAGVDEQKIKSGLLDKFVDTTYKGSASKLVMALLGNGNTSAKELEEIKAMIKNLDQK